MGKSMHFFSLALPLLLEEHRQWNCKRMDIYVHILKYKEFSIRFFHPGKRFPTDCLCIQNCNCFNHCNRQIGPRWCQKTPGASRLSQKTIHKQASISTWNLRIILHHHSRKKLLTNTIIISLNPTHSSLTSLLHHEERKCKKLHNRQQISSSGYAKYTTKASLELEFCYQHLHSRNHMTNNLEKTRQSSIVTSLDTDNRNLVGFRVYCSRTKD
jgi:hypothetical protein